jgi:hypothetical protein
MKRAITLAQAKEAYPHRFTCEHVPAWAKRSFREAGGTKDTYPAPQFASDAEWYENTVFPDEQGHDETADYCETRNQSWPCGKELLCAFGSDVYWVVDDCIDASGHEGYELLRGNPYSTVGVRIHAARRLHTVLAKVPHGEKVYRVRLARRHGTHSVKLINTN